VKYNGQSVLRDPIARRYKIYVGRQKQFPPTNGASLDNGEPSKHGSTKASRRWQDSL